MSFCPKCGAEVKSTFCPKCGNQMEQEPASYIKQEEKEEKSMGKQSTGKTGTKWLVGMVTVLVLLAGVYFLLPLFFNPVEKVEVVQRAVASDDTEELFETVSYDKEALLDRESYLAYLKDGEWEQVVRDMKGIVRNGEETGTVKGENGEPLFTLKENSSYLGLKKDYDIKAVPRKVELSSNVTPLDVSSGEKTWTIEGEGVGMDVYPGVHSLQARYENEFGTQNKSHDITLEEFQQDVEEVVFTMNDATYTFATSYPEAALYINGETTGKQLQEFNELGPFGNEEVVLKAVYEKDTGETIESNELYASDIQTASSGVPVFQFEDEPATPMNNKLDPEKAAVVYRAFRADYEEALNDIDFSEIERHLAADSPVYYELNEYISDLKDEGFYYEFHSNEVLGYEEQGGVVTLRANEQFTFTNHRGAQTYYDRDKEYTLHQIGNDYYLYKIEIIDTNRNEL